MRLMQDYHDPIFVLKGEASRSSGRFSKDSPTKSTRQADALANLRLKRMKMLVLESELNGCQRNASRIYVTERERAREQGSLSAAE